MGGEPKRAALIVASQEYRDPGLRRLRAPPHDAEALARVLGNPQIGDFDVRTLLDQPEHVIRQNVEEFFADRRPDDLLLLHFSCHGVKDEGGELYFAMADTQLRLLGATAVAAEFVNRCMNRSRSRRVVLLLDCCYAGAFERGMAARADRGMGIEERFGGRGRAVITASSAMEYAFEGTELADSSDQTPSLFTSALVRGLETGDADRDQDGQAVSGGILLGTAAAVTWGWLGDAANAVTTRYGEPGLGLWLSLASGLVLTLAACIAAVAMVRAGTRPTPPAPRAALPWLVTFLGAAGALVFFAIRDQIQVAAAPGLAIIALAFLVSAVAVLATPRQLAVGLLAGWIAGALAVVGFYLINLPRNGIERTGILAFGATLVALLVATIPFSRADRARPG